MKYCLLPRGAIRAFLHELRSFDQVIAPLAYGKKGIAMGEGRPFLGPPLQNPLRVSPESRGANVQRPPIHPRGAIRGQVGPNCEYRRKPQSVEIGGALHTVALLQL